MTDDIGRRFQFNTPIAAVMELVNELAKDTAAPDARFAAETALSLIQPYAPHVAEELWQRLGHERLWEQPWPEADPRLLERETFELVVQVNGKVRDRFEVDAELPEQTSSSSARWQSERVRAHLNGKQVRKTIVVPGKLVNLVVAASGFPCRCAKSTRVLMPARTRTVRGCGTVPNGRWFVFTA